MAAEDRTFLRLKGTFVWPPVQNHGAPGSATGSVEIGYQKDGNGYRAYIRWLPDAETAGDAPPVTSQPEIDPTHWESRRPFRYWIDGLSHDFEFRGGQLFEGYDATASHPSPDPAFVSPLRHGAEAIHHSRIARGLDTGEDNNKACFGASLSLPVFQATDSGRSSLRSWVQIADRRDTLPSLRQLPKSISNGGFAFGQAGAVLKALGVTADRQGLGDVRVEASIGRPMNANGSKNPDAIVEYDVIASASLFPALKNDQGAGMLCSLNHKLHQHTLIAHTSSRALWIDAGVGTVTIRARVTWRRETPQSPPSLSPSTAELSIHWSDLPRSSPPDFAREVPCLSLHQLLLTACDQARSGVTALAGVSGGQPQSFLPDIKLDPYVCVPLDARLSESLRAHDGTDGLPQGEHLAISPATSPAMRFTIAANGTGVNGSVRWPAFASELAGVPSNALRISLGYLDPSDPADDPATESSEWVAGFKLKVTVPPSGSNSPIYTLGSQKLVGHALFAGDSLGDVVIRSPRTRPLAERPAPGHPFEFKPQTEFRFRLPLAAVEPVGTDVPWGERELETPPLLVPLDTQPSQQRDPLFSVEVTETIGPDTDRHLKAEITEKTNTPSSSSAEPTGGGAISPPDPGSSVSAGPAAHSSAEQPRDNRFVLLSTEPFGILRFSRLPLDLSGDQTNAIVAVFDSDTRMWLFKKVSQEYRYDFPPQGIGEASDKPGQWEIYDLTAEGNPGDDILLEDDPGYVSLVRSRPKDKDNASYIVDCRFSPSTTLWIRPSDLERNYFLPEWAAHDILRQRNDFGIGAALSALRGEFLYGLAVGLATRNETGPARTARVAALEALTGRLPQRQYTQAADPAVRDLAARWGAVRRALKTRHERLEIWTPAPADPRPFGPARFKDGVRYALRLDTAFVRPPLTEVKAAIEDWKLPGGALWPIESQLFYDAIKNSPQSSGGTIERIALGPTGGDADLRAEFLGGTLAIVAEVRGGFVQRQRVEILGRIGVLWHRAKHVVVYERTVNPSAQFAPERDEPGVPGWSQFRSRRPIVRKVNEFIELMEPTRRYPDLGSTDAGTCGFLDSVRFNSRTINVDSSWANDVIGDNGATRGYTIPLWNRGAARRRPQVYPEPDVAFVTIGEGKEDRPLAAQQCLDTDNLYFYAEPTPGGNPDAWTDVFGVDWGHVLPPSVIDRELTPGGASHDAPDGGRKAPVPRIMPGYRRFTWRLTRADTKTAVNAGYSEKPVYVGLDSVTFSRRLPETRAETNSTLDSFRKQASVVSQLTSLIGDLDAAANAKDEHRIRDVCTQISSVSFPNPIGDEYLKQLLSPLAGGDCTSGLTHIQGKLAALIGAKGRLLARSARELIDSQCDALESDAQRLVDVFKPFWDSSDDNDLRRRLTEALAKSLPLRRQVDEAIGVGETAADTIGNEVEKARALLHGVLGAFRTALEDLRSRIDAVRSSFHSAEVWSKQRASTLRVQVNELLSGVTARLEAEVYEAKHRFTAALGPLALHAIGKTADLFASVDDVLTDVITSVQPIGEYDGYAECCRAVDDILDSISRKIAAIETARSTIDASLSSLPDTIKDLVNAGGGTLSDKAAEILAKDVIANALVKWIPDDQINEISVAVAVAASTPDKLKQQLQKLGNQIRGESAHIADSLMTAVESSALNGLAEISAAAEHVCDAIKKQIPEDFGLPDLIPIWQRLIRTLPSTQTHEDVTRWLEGNRKTLQESTAAWHSYSGVVSERFAALREGDFRAAPGNALRLISAATTAPEIGVLQANADRIRCSYEKGKVEVTKVKATLNRLGDALKAMGIDVPFDGIGDTLTIPEADFEKLDIRKLFPSFGGLDLTHLLGDLKVPKGVKDAVRITHDFDRKQLRAWVQVDVDVPAPGRSELYSAGPFALYFRDTKLTGRMRAEASQDEEAVRDTGSGEIATNIDAVVDGELLLSLEQVRITYSGTSGLKFEFDPKHIRLHAAMQFVQDTLGDLFADEVGGLAIIKERGVPVGVEHLFSLPTVDLMAGTSGIANIQIGNAFRLRAYPEFVIANRFNLSRPEAPFLFTFFLFGGTGYTFIDTSYSPLSNTLAVTVEAAAGGAAAFGFSAGPVKGAVFITFSLAITYRKVISTGQQVGDGLAVSVILVIAGNCSIYGMITIGLELMLRIMYREGGRIDGFGTLAVKVKVSRLLTLKYRTEITYTLRDGRSTASVRSSSAAGLDQAQQQKLNRIKGYAKQLEAART